MSMGIPRFILNLKRIGVNKKEAVEPPFQYCFVLY